MYFARRRARLAMARHGQRGRVVAVLPVAGTGEASPSGPPISLSLPLPLPVALAGVAVAGAYALGRWLLQRPRREVPRDLRPTEKMLLVATEERLLVFDDNRTRSPLIWEDRGRLRGVSSRLSENYAGDVVTIQIERHPDVSFEVNGLLMPERMEMLRAIERLVRH